MRINLKNSCGFTFVELLIVVGIIGILSTLSIVYINPSLQLKRARDNQRIAEIKQIQSALEQYKGDKGNYPAFGTAASPTYGWAGIGSIFLNSAGGSAGAVATVSYLRNIPTGPNTGGNACKGYVYAVTGGGTGYTIFTILEDKNGKVAQSAKITPIVPSSSNISVSLGNKTAYFTLGACASSTNYNFNYWVNSP